MIKSNVRSVTTEHDGTSGKGYYCAGRHCAIKNQCHRYTASIDQENVKFNDYDAAQPSEIKCKYFAAIKEVIQAGR